MATTPTKLAKASQTRQDAAWRAVQQFNSMLPTLSAFARVMTGDPKVTVRAGKFGSQTDGVNIWITPPIELGNNVKHDSNLCDYRDENKRRRCEACDIRESTLWSLYHEVAHIASNSMAAPRPDQVEKISKLIDKYHPVGICSHGTQKKAEAFRAGGMLELLGTLTDYLREMMRSIEDARVDTAMVLARPGLRALMEARAHRIFNVGFCQRDGTYKHWRTAPFEAQVLVGVLLVAESIPIEPHYFSTRVQEVIADPALCNIVREAPYAQDVHGTVDITIRLWDRFQEMGLFKTERCQQAPPSIPSENQEQDDNSSDSGEGSDPGDAGENGSQLPDSEDETSDCDPGGDSGADSGGESDSDLDTGSDGENNFENEDSSRSGDDKKDGDGNADSDDGEVSKSDSVDSSGSSPDSGDPEDTDGDRNSSEELGDGSDSQESGTDESGSPAHSGGSSDSSAVGGGSTDEDDQPSTADNSTSPDSGDGTSNGHADKEDQDTSGDASESSAEPTGAGADDSTKESESEWEKDSQEIKGSEAWNEEDDGPLPIDDLVGPDELAEILRQFTGHHGATHKIIQPEIDSENSEEVVIDTGLHDEGEKQKTIAVRKLDIKAVVKALGQALAFDTSSRDLGGLIVVKYPHRPFNWYPARSTHVPSAFMPPESIIGASLLNARLVFSENARGHEQRGLKSGRVDASRLGRRAPVQDPRIFKKKILPGKRDYFVVLGLDCSGSTDESSRMELIKRSAFGMTELLHRLGVKFAVYAHTGGPDLQNIYNWHTGIDNVWMLEIKSAAEPWSREIKDRLAQLAPVANNFDGHTLEFYRKVLDSRPETDKIIMYYTDGQMPAANYHEELLVLQREIAECNKRQYTNMAIGIRTDSPRAHGFDTVVMDNDGDLPKVIAHLGKKLTQR